MAPKHQPTVVRALPVQQLLKTLDRVAHVPLLPGPLWVVDSYHQVSGFCRCPAYAASETANATASYTKLRWGQE